MNILDQYIPLRLGCGPNAREPVLATGTKGRVITRWTAEEDAMVRRMYATHSCEQMAAQLGRTTSQVRNRCWKFGLEYLKGPSAKPLRWTDSELTLLRKAYAAAPADELLKLDRLARKLGRHKANVCRKARSLGLTNQQRPDKQQTNLLSVRGPKFANAKELSEARSAWIQASFALKGHPRGALGMRHTPAVKERIGIKSRDRWARMTEEERGDHVLMCVKAKRAKGVPFANPRGSWKAGWREVGEQRCFFRSRWEANYARYLEWLRTIGQIGKWEHEPHTFWFEGIKRGCVSYLPDFRVTEINGSVQWHEVKGWMDARSKTTIARMARYHPTQVLIVIREAQYKEIMRKVSSLIPGWES